MDMKNLKRIKEITKAAIKNGALWIISNDRYGNWDVYRINKDLESLSWVHTFIDFREMCDWVSKKKNNEVEYIH